MNTAPVDLGIGCRVEINGLQKAPQLNGKRGTIVKVGDPPGHRRNVQIDGTVQTPAVKPTNLRDINRDITGISDLHDFTLEVCKLVESGQVTQAYLDEVKVFTNVPLRAVHQLDAYGLPGRSSSVQS